MPAVVVAAFSQDFKTNMPRVVIVPVAILYEDYMVTGEDNLVGERRVFLPCADKGVLERGDRQCNDQAGVLKYSKEVIKDTPCLA